LNFESILSLKINFKIQNTFSTIGHYHSTLAISTHWLSFLLSPTVRGLNGENQYWYMNWYQNMYDQYVSTWTGGIWEGPMVFSWNSQMWKSWICQVSSLGNLRPCLTLLNWHLTKIVSIQKGTSPSKCA
jgi:hypothetical protein